MKIAVVTPHGSGGIEKQAKSAGFSVSKKSPDFVIAYGGDGTMLKSERLYPGVPKVPFKKSSTFNKCAVYRISRLGDILRALKKRGYRIREFGKVEGKAKGKVLTGLNEIQVHNSDPRKALRLDIVSGQRKMEGVIGDGIVAATPYGSTGYYHAIGYETFDRDVRIGFNNTTPKIGFIGLKGNEEARITIRREKGMLFADNSRKSVALSPGDEIVIRASKETARFVEIL